MAQKQEISDACKAQDKVAAELTTLQAKHDSLRKEHIAQKQELNTAMDNIDTLLDNNTKAQDMIKKLMSEVQAKQNSFDNLSTAHGDLQA